MEWSRAAVSVGLLLLAAALFFGAPEATHDQVATVIVGLVAGYWLRHAEALVKPEPK